VKVLYSCCVWWYHYVSGAVQALNDSASSKGRTFRGGDLTNDNRWDSKEALDLFADDPHLYLAKHDFAPTGPGQLALKRGDKIQVKSYNDVGDWCEGETDSGAIGWIPTSYVAKLDSLEKHSWYHGSVSRTEAEYRLSSGINGSFLVRESESKPGQYSISLRYDGRVYHYRISSGDDGDYFITPDAKFTMLSTLVHHHSNHSDGLITTLHYPAVNPTKPPVYSLSHEVDKWEVERSDLEMGAKLGAGQYGEVYKAIFKLMGKTVAVKTFKVCFSNKEYWCKKIRTHIKTVKKKNQYDFILKNFL